MGCQNRIHAKTYFLCCASMCTATIDIRSLIRCIYPCNSRGLAFVTQASTQDSQNLKPEPPRIRSNVKLSLQFLKMAKDFKNEKKGASRPSTGYRKKKVEKGQLSDDGESYEGPTTNLYYTDHCFELARPVLLVDGYNMCGYWNKLKRHFKKGNLEDARRTLLEELVTFSAIKSVKVVVVFDAALSGLSNHKEMFQGVDVVFSASTSADTWIEKEVALLKEDGCPKVWVATSDLVQQQCASAAGAFVWSCRVLLAEIKDAKKERDEILLDRKSYSMEGKLLEHNLDPDVLHTLQNLKKQLAQSEPT